MGLPLLVLNKRTLSPQFGYAFDRRWLQPYESIIGMLWKFTRMNLMSSHTVIKHLGRCDTDPYEGIAVAEIDIAHVATILRIPQRSIRAGLVPTHRGCSPHLRHCPRCIDMGYHGRAHQFLGINYCPAHGEPLVTFCPRCKQPSTYRLDAQLLHAPFRCRHCHRGYGRRATSPWVERWTLPQAERTAFTRANVD